MSHTWNYRVIQTYSEKYEEYSYMIHEVYYDGDTITGWTEDPVPPYGETLDELLDTLENMVICLAQPVLVEHIGEDGKPFLCEALAPCEHRKEIDGSLDS